MGALVKLRGAVSAMASVLIDVSNNNGAINFKKVAAAKVNGRPVVGVFCKVNEGNFIDPDAARYVRDARAAGLLVGGYDFIRPRTDRTGAQEFDMFWRECKKLGLHRKGSLRPVIDVEALTKQGKLPLPPAQIRAYVKSWIARCVQVTGKHPIIYTGHWYWVDLIHETRRYGCKLWLAAYVPRSEVKRFIPKAWAGRKSFWQYTDKGTVPGVAGKVDVNVYGSTLRNLKRAHTL